MRALNNLDMRSRIPSARKRIFSRVGAFDLLWALVSPFLAFLVRDGTLKQLDAIGLYATIAVLASLLAFQWFRLSAPISRYFSVNDALSVIKASLTTVALAAVVTFTFTRLDDAPRSVPLIHFIILSGGLIAWRTGIRLLSTRESIQSPPVRCQEIENILVIGATRLAWFFVKMLDEFAASESRVLALLDERPELQGRTLNGYQIVGSPMSLSKLMNEYASHGIDIGKVVIAANPHDLTGAVWVEIRSACSARNVQIEWLPERFLFSRFAALSSSTAPDEDKIFELAKRPYWKVKRALDFLFALVTLIVLAPLTLLVALLVLIDVGYPVVFWQQRTGRFGRPLYVYKFRTMREAVVRTDPTVHDAGGASYLGWLLRRSRLDEIPQLFNVLSGGMSLIGPRPLLPIDQPKNLRVRLQVRPGLSGLAQINGGKLLMPEEKDALDEWYVRHASPWLDLKIVIRTIWVILRGDRRNEAAIMSAMAERKIRLQATATAILS